MNTDEIKKIAQEKMQGIDYQIYDCESDLVTYNSTGMVQMFLWGFEYAQEIKLSGPIWRSISELKNEMDSDKIWIKTESGKIFRFTDDFPCEIITHFMILE